MLKEKICGEILDHLKPYGVLDTDKTRKQLSVLPIYTVLPIYNNENKTSIENIVTYLDKTNNTVLMGIKFSNTDYYSIFEFILDKNVVDGNITLSEWIFVSCIKEGFLNKFGIDKKIILENKVNEENGHDNIVAVKDGDEYYLLLKDTYREMPDWTYINDRSYLCCFLNIVDFIVGGNKINLKIKTYNRGSDFEIKNIDGVPHKVIKLRKDIGEFLTQSKKYELEFSCEILMNIPAYDLKLNDDNWSLWNFNKLSINGRIRLTVCNSFKKSIELALLDNKYYVPDSTSNLGYELSMYWNYETNNS